MHLLPSSSSRRSPKTKTHERGILTGMERTMEFGAATTDPLRLLPNRTHPTQRFHIEGFGFVVRLRFFFVVRDRRDLNTAVLERRKAVNRLLVDEAINHVNSVVALHPETMEKLHRRQNPHQGDLDQWPIFRAPN